MIRPLFFGFQILISLISLPAKNCARQKVSLPPSFHTPLHQKKDNERSQRHLHQRPGQSLCVW